MFKTPLIIKRCERNPIMTASQVPYDAVLIFNAAVAKYQGKYVMLFRNDHDFKREEFEAMKNGAFF